jgi:2-amino-4-hydroxy-6-hydroxymethyldihydropteridine diphosphokinase
MISFYLSLGSNIGDRLAFLLDALQRLRQTKDIYLESVSSVYETAPVGIKEQRAFLNMALGGATSLDPRDLLNVILDIERDLGRERDIRWGPRTIDIDILTFGDNVISKPELQVPHPRMKERAFVLIPLAEIAPNLSVPIDCPENKHTTPLELLKGVKDKSGVELWKHIDLEIGSGPIGN